MQKSLKQFFALVAVAAVVCVVATWLLQSQSSDFWGYGKLGVSDGSSESHVYYLEVRGVGTKPTVARLVRFANHSAAPSNALEISHAVSPEFASHVQNADRWNGKCTLIAGRTNDEKITIQLDGATAKTLFAQPGTRYDDYETFEALWDQHIAPHLPADR